MSSNYINFGPKILTSIIFYLSTFSFWMLFIFILFLILSILEKFFIISQRIFNILQYITYISLLLLNLLLNLYILIFLTIWPIYFGVEILYGEVKFYWATFFSSLGFGNFYTHTQISLTYVNGGFLLLFSYLFSLIFYFILQDITKNVNLYCYIFVGIIICTYWFLLVNNIILFYILYEMIVFLTYFVIYLSSNARGSTEAASTYLGWALLGSVFLTIGIGSWLFLTNQPNFVQTFEQGNLTSSELYWIYFFCILGFGTKLSLWPFWYWLPKAHVEVSTGASIYLSCVLIKIAVYGLIKIKYLINLEISYNIFIILSILGIVEISVRVVNIKDLKALVAYSSVLHTNLFIILLHVDQTKLIAHIHMYIWGHSLTTAALFIVINLIELVYNTRNSVFITGMWILNPQLSYLVCGSIILFLDFPCSFFFWAELKAWLYIYSAFPCLVFFLIILVSFVFLFSFFKIWWGMLFGVPYKFNNLKPVVLNQNIIRWLILILLSQYILGLQPIWFSSLFSFFLV